MNCPNCGVEFAEKIDKAFRCDSCGWLTEIDGQWHPCKAPAKQVEPDPPKAEPKPEREPGVTEAIHNELIAAEALDAQPAPGPAEPEPQVKSYLGGLVTVTTIKDDPEIRK